MSATRLVHPNGGVLIADLDGSRRRVTVESRSAEYVPHRSCITRYPVDLIRRILAVKGPAWVCDEILREEDPGYVERNLRFGMFSFLAPAAFSGGRVLDFGCGCGASTLVLARLLPESEIIGVELVPELVAVGAARASFYGTRNVRFLQSHDPTSLPHGLGLFDFVSLSAVYEHLLPNERRTLLPRLWRALSAGGVLFVNQTPYRWFPVESHTTFIPLLNYLPDRAAHALARRFPKVVRRSETWNDLLRRGIRGGSVRELRELLGPSGEPDLLPISGLGMRDAIDVWFASVADNGRLPRVKRAARLLLKGLKATTRITLVPTITLALKRPT